MHEMSCAAFEQVAARLSSVPRVAGLTAKGVASIDVATGALALAKAPDCRMAPASTVKLATALLLARARRGALDETVTIQPSDCIRGSTMGLEPGDIISYRGLLYGLMLTSGNDAAQAIARVIGADMPGRVQDETPFNRFVRGLNRLGYDLGLRRTRFLNPSGLPQDGQLTTARELAALGVAAFSDSLVRSVAGLREASIDVGGRRPRLINLRSAVDLTAEPQVLAAKTGTSPHVGANLVFLSGEAGRTTVTALLGCAVQWKSNIVPGTDRRYDDARRVIAFLHRDGRKNPRSA